MRAVFYCRVSTDEENQLNALEDQIEESRKCILKLGWELCGSYVDEGKTGTTTKRRNEYKRLVEDLYTNKFDVIVIKSQDRLMRNTKDWYLFIDALLSNKKQLYFYLESKFYTPDDALITGIKAILAEEYSRELSRKIKHAHKNRQEKGESVLLTSATWGYDKVDKKVVVNEQEAEVVRLIYSLCIQGYGSRLISKELSKRGITGRSGGYFPEVTVRKIIRNPLFKGESVMNKKTVDFATKRTVLTPSSEWKIHKGAVPAIVTPQVWEAANKVMDSRSRVVKSDGFAERAVGRNLGKYDLSSKIFCGLCGSTYWRKYRRYSKEKNKIIIDWMCSEYIRRGRRGSSNVLEGCDNTKIKEADMMNIVSNISGNILKDNKKIIVTYTTDIIKGVLDGAAGERLELEKAARRIINQKDFILNKLLEGTISDRDYRRKSGEFEKQLGEIESKKKQLDKSAVSSEDMHKRLEDIKSILNNADIGDVQVLKLLKRIEKIIVDPYGLEVYFDFRDKIRVDLIKDTHIK